MRFLDIFQRFKKEPEAIVRNKYVPIFPDTLWTENRKLKAELAELRAQHDYCLKYTGQTIAEIVAQRDELLGYKKKRENADALKSLYGTKHA